MGRGLKNKVQARRKTKDARRKMQDARCKIKLQAERRSKNKALQLVESKNIFSLNLES
jgi:hypothetical protein